jgi:hypothetical protein
MCDLQSSFKLCSCSNAIDLTQPFWELKYETKISESFVMGVYLFNKKEKEKYVVSDELQRITLKLNESDNPFDFPYSPNEGDLLNIFDGKNIFRFNQTGYEWIPLTDDYTRRYRYSKVLYSKSTFGTISN